MSLTEKTKMSKFHYTKIQIKQQAHATLLEWRDILWMLSMNTESVPLWTGWNAQLSEDHLPLHTNKYMENITLPPTQLNVVLETLKVSQRVAEECQQDYSIVTYGLAIAKLAMQIQAEETARFDNVFICFGAFHISLAFFGCLGSFIDRSSGPNILTETEILASGSLRGCTLGKHYNRCKRIHPMLATALTQLHFQAYPATIDKDTDGIHQMLQTFNADPSPASLEVLEQSEEYFDLMTRYE